MKPVFHYNGDEGSVSFPSGWKDVDAIIRCDLLNDWIIDLQAELERSRLNLSDEMTDLVAAVAVGK